MKHVWAVMIAIKDSDDYRITRIFEKFDDAYDYHKVQRHAGYRTYVEAWDVE